MLLQDSIHPNTELKRMNDTVNPLVSVVIPTYNHARFIGRALQSVLNQTYTNWEAIVIDNHSTDNTDEVLACFPDPRISCLKIHNNGVIAASRNAGIRVAKGEWIAFLDSDDWWTVDKLEICMKFMNANVDLLYHKLRLQWETSGWYKRKYNNSWQVKTPVLFDLLLNGNAIATSSVIVRKYFLDVVGGMDENTHMIAAEDYNTWLRISKITNNFYYISEALGNYLVHNSGVSQKDMSVSARYAVGEFLELLNNRQLKIVESWLKFTAKKFYCNVNNKSLLISDLFYLLINGSLIIKIKSLFFLIKFKIKIKSL